MDFCTDDNSWRSARAAANFASLLQLQLANEPGVEWVERAQLDLAKQELKLSDMEFALIKEHSQAGYEILRDIDFAWPVAQIVLQHHERVDGSGYPQGLKGDQILIGAQILAVADVVEAISSYRPYRPALGIDAALEEIEKNKGILYDEKVVETCIKLFREKGFKFE